MVLRRGGRGLLLLLLLQLRRSLPLRAQVHLAKLLAERIGVLRRRLPVRGLSVARRCWLAISWRRLAVALGWGAIARRRCAVSRDGGLGRSSSSSALVQSSIGSELVRGARVSVPLLAIRHDAERVAEPRARCDRVSGGARGEV